MKKNVLGIKIDDITMEEALDKVQGWLSKPGKPQYRTVRGKHYIVTPNPEIVVMAQKDEELKRIINKADLAIPDGVGLKLTGDIVCILPGIDFMEALVKMASEKAFTIGLLGGIDRVAERVAERLKSRYPELKISFAIQGPVIPARFAKRAKAGIHTNDNLWIPDPIRQAQGPEYIEGQVRDDKCDILFVAFGPPKQEKWIANNLSKLDIKVAMGVGGAFDYISGKVPRAPVWMRVLGLEWLFRLAVQPWRIKRQLALLIYIWLLTKENFNARIKV